jgi:hypothetical protein
VYPGGLDQRHPRYRDLFWHAHINCVSDDDDWSTTTPVMSRPTHPVKASASHANFLARSQVLNLSIVVKREKNQRGNTRDEPRFLAKIIDSRVVIAIASCRAEGPLAPARLDRHRAAQLQCAGGYRLEGRRGRRGEEARARTQPDACPILERAENCR